MSGLSDADAPIAAILIGCSNSYASDLMAEIADVGIIVEGDYNRICNAGADLTFAEGWRISGDKNTFVSCHAVAVGRAGANTYSGFKTTGRGNRFSPCENVHAGNGNTAKYAFEDTVADGAVSARNTYDESCGGDYSTALLKPDTYW